MLTSVNPGGMTAPGPGSMGYRKGYDAYMLYISGGRMSADQSPFGMGKSMPEVFSTSIAALVLVAYYIVSPVWKGRV